ncbi:MAG TPA: oxidoreductase [Chitinophagales bacterium]|nr:oxidoreductase [Chitinophagales bacterium]
MNNLQDKVIIVTGGSGLIGTATVAHLKQLGAKAINAEIAVKEDNANDVIACDVTSPESVNSMIAKVVEKYGHIDGIVNNAYPRTADWGNKFEDVKLESWKANVDSQLNSCFYMCQQMAELMRKQGRGSIVNIASIYGIVGNDFTVYENTGGMTSPAAYSAIKGGVINFTRYLASYYGKHNVRVNCVSPGGVFNNQHETFVKNFENKVPLRRMAQADDIAPAVAFLLSDGAKYITGHNLVVDGGWTAI